MSHIFKNVSFEDVGCSLCHKPHKSLECPSLRSIIEMEVSSSISPNDTSSSSSDTRSCSPDYSSRRPRYFDRSHSYSRSPNSYDKSNSSRYDSYDARDYYNRFRSNDRYYQNRNDCPIYNYNRYDRSDSYSPQCNSRCYNSYDNPAPSQQWQGQGHNQCRYQDSNSYCGYGKNSYNQPGNRCQNRGYCQNDNNFQLGNNNKCQTQSYGGNGQNPRQNFFHKAHSLSNLSSFVTLDGVTFHARKNQVFQNNCTEEYLHLLLCHQARNLSNL